jgi:tetratricopeptide (TPR) repeat protein
VSRNPNQWQVFYNEGVNIRVLKICLVSLILVWSSLFLCDYQVTQQVHLADQLLSKKQPDAAEVVLRQVEKTQPWRQLDWNRLALQFLLRGEPEKALSALQPAGGYGRLSFEGWLTTAKVYQETGQSQKVEPVLLEALRLAKTSAAQVAVLKEIILFYRAENQFEDALKWQKRLSSLSPSTDDSRIDEVLLQTVVNPEVGLTDWQSLSEKPDWLQQWGLSLTEALSEPNEARRWVMIGQAYGAAGVWDLAEYAFTCAVNLIPDYAEAWGLLAEARQQQKNDGREQIEKALELAPRSAAVRLLGALYYRRQSDFGKAIALLQKNVEDQPDEVLWYLELGHTQANAGRFENAVQTYQEAVKYFPEDITALAALSRFCVQYDYRLEDIGLPTAQQIILLEPESAEAYDILGQVWFAIGETTQASDAYQNALSQDADYAPAWLHIGQMALAEQDSLTARVALEKAVDLAGGSEEGKLASRLLKQYFNLSVNNTDN